MKIQISLSATPAKTYSIWETYETTRDGFSYLRHSHWLGKANPKRMSKEAATKLAKERTAKPPRGYEKYRAKVMQSPTK